MKNYKQDGHVLTIPAPEDVVSGQVVKINDFIGVAITDAESGEDCAFQLTGVIRDAPKAAGETWAVGQLLAYSVANENFTTTTTSALACAHVAVAALSAATTGDVLLGVRAVNMGA